MNRTFLVTGGAGFIGSHVVDRLLSRGQRVVCVDSFDAYYAPAIKRRNCASHQRSPYYELVEADICDSTKLGEAFAFHRPDVVIHLAARAGVRGSMEHPVECERTNVQGTISILEMARRFAPSRIVCASSSSVYGNDVDGPAAEDRPLCPASPYGATKLAAEAMCQVYARQYGLSIASMRFFTVYGARQRPDMAISRFVRRLLRGEALPIYGDGSARRDFTFVSDIADGILAAADLTSPGHEAINLGSGAPVTVAELIRRLGFELVTRPNCCHLPEQPGDVYATHADIRKARRLLGFSPKVSLRDGLRRYVDSIRTELGWMGRLQDIARSAPPGQVAPLL